MKKLFFLLLTALTVNASTVSVNTDKSFLGANAPRNYIQNSGAEKNDRFVTDSSSIHSRTTTTPLFGAGSHLIDASAGSQDVDFLADNFEAGLLGQNCEAQFSVSGDATLYTAIVRINGADVTVPMALPNVANSQQVSILFPCGTSSVSPVLRISSTGDGAAIKLDEVYIGKALSLGNVNQVGDWQTFTPTGSWTSGVTYSGFWRRVGSNFQAEIKVLITGTISPAATVLRINMPFSLVIDSSKIQTSSTQRTGLGFANIQDFGTATHEGQTIYDSNTSSVQIRYANSSGVLVGVTDTAPIAAPISGDEIYIGFKVPIVGWTSTQSYSLMNTYWKVDANISGANIDLGVVTVSDYTGITNGSLTLTNNSGTGNIAAQIGCSSTNAPTGTTCSSGDESVSVAFTPQGTFPQDVLACASFAWNGSATAGSQIVPSFQIVETPTNAQTILAQGRSRISAGQIASAGATQDVALPFRICGTFTFTSGGQKALRLFYEQLASGTVTKSFINADSSAAVGQRDIHWEVYPLSFQTPAPILVGGVTSSSTSAERIERARINLSGASACSIVSQSGSWISSVSATGGNCTVNFTSGTFSSAPNCSCNVAPNATNSWCRGANSLPTITSGQFTSRDTANNLVAQEFDLVCTGPR